MTEKKLHIASWVLVGLLLLPLLQQVTGVFHERKLKGAVKIAAYPEWSIQEWFGGSLQEPLEQALNDRAGFRPFFIRVNNQVAFSLYRKALASGVIIGKQNYMYEKNYILASQGKDYVGDSVILSNAVKLRAIQDHLESQGKHLVVTFAAGKGSFYPEYFPDRYREPSSVSGKNAAEPDAAATPPGASGNDPEDPAFPREGNTPTSDNGNRPHDSAFPREGNAPLTNLEAYKQAFTREGVHYIDFNDWFLAMKDTSRYCLYPRTGVHWSYYGMVLVTDSLRNYLEEAVGRPMPEFTWGDVKLSRRYRSSDADIEEGMNILFRVNCDRLAYPKISFRDEGYDKPKGVVIADSFYWGLHNLGFSNRMLDQGEFWYYFKRIYGTDEVILIEDIDAYDRLMEADVVILMATEATLTKFPFGFVETIYPQVKGEESK